MVDEKVVLITGVAGQWGGQAALSLLGNPGYHVIGLDSEPPDSNLVGLDFIEADIRNPLLVELLISEKVDTVCHLKVIDHDRPSESVFDHNVMGTMKLFGACAESGVRKIVFMSSTAVYGARPGNSAFLSEDNPLLGSRENGYVRDLVEIEAFCNGYRRQYPQVSLTLLRYPNIIGPSVDTPMTRFLSEPFAPVLLGFDPMMQVIHEQDVFRSIIHCVENDHPGIFNVAAEGALPLSKLLALSGKIPLPVLHFFAYWGKDLMGAGGLKLTQYIPFDLDYIRYPWVAEISKMMEVLGYQPIYTPEEALREFAGRQRLRKFMPESSALAYDEARLRDTLERRRRLRELRSANVEGLLEGKDDE